MDLSTITMERPAAREAFLEYRRALRDEPARKLGEAQREYEQLDRAVMRGYKAIAAGHQLLELSKALASGGVEMREVLPPGWASDQRPVIRALPKLAVIRADARRCLTTGVKANGAVTFHADEIRQFGGRKADHVTAPEDTFVESERSDDRWVGVEFAAVVPIVPPQFRPPHSLSGYHILWEAEWGQRVPVDPALLKHLGGDLYAVLAVWDLTPLEQAVLAARLDA